MIVDTSALAAIVFREPGSDELFETIVSAEPPAAVTAPTLVELGLVLSSLLDTDARPIVNRMVEQFQLEVIPFTTHHWNAAIGAFIRFGRGRHPAALNFGDCLTYAASSLSGEPLLFVGNGFTQTDIEPV